MSYICSQGTAVECLPASSLDTHQLPLWSGTHTPARYSENAQPMDGSPVCGCTKETLGCSIHPSTRDEWIASMRDSLAQILAQPGNKQELALKREVASTVKPYASLASFDRSTCSWKTSQKSLITDLELFLQTWPRSGMTRNGYVYALPTVGRRMNEIDGGYLATPTCASNQLAPSMMKHKSCRALAKTLNPTPTAHDYKKGAYPSEFKRNTPGIAVILGGKPSPNFQEWQMGWPINYTALKVLGMGKSRSKPQPPGDCSEARK